MKTETNLPDTPGAPALALATGSAPLVSYPTAEHYFIDRDIFVEYVRSTLNPAREREGLSICTAAVASHLFDVITSGRFRGPNANPEPTGAGAKKNEDVAAIEAERLAGLPIGRSDYVKEWLRGFGVCRDTAPCREAADIIERLEARLKVGRLAERQR